MKQIVYASLVVIGIFAMALCFVIVLSDIKYRQEVRVELPVQTDYVKYGFDTSALKDWRGNATGQIRMVGAQYYDDSTLEDETGNLWGISGVTEQAFYLLWIDNMGTPAVEDDMIIKIWQEK